MMKLVAKYPLAVIAAVLILFLIIAWIVPWIGEVAQGVDRVLAAIGFLLLAFNQIYANSERFFLWVNQLRFRVMRETIRWNFTIDLSGFESSRPLEDVFETIVGANIQGTTVWANHSDLKIVNMPGYTLRLFMTSPSPDIPEPIPTADILTLQLSNLELPFSRYRAKIDGEVFPLIERVVDALRPDDKKYSVKIGFQSPNPYFGFFVRRLDVPKVLAFQCDIFESVAGREETVTIDKDSVTIVAGSLQAARMLSSKYVALSVPSR